VNTNTNDINKTTDTIKVSARIKPFLCNLFIMFTPIIDIILILLYNTIIINTSQNIKDNL
jgi:hypothetical protein